MKRILISGGAGFIGSNLTIKLVKKGYVVTILDNLSEQIHGKEAESVLYKSVKSISNFIKGDVRNKADWEKAINNQDAIIHLAAETGTGQSMYEKEKYTEVNIEGTKNLIDILKQTNHQIQKVIVASSRAIYGEGKYSCNQHGVSFPDERKETDLMAGRFNPICRQCDRNYPYYPQMNKQESIRFHTMVIQNTSKKN